MLQVTSLFSARAIAKTKWQYREFIRTANGKKNMFRSVYHFDHLLKNGKPDFSDVIINQIFIEFDVDNSYEVSQKFALALSNDNIKFRINFSGRRGFHFYIKTEHQEIDRKTYLTALYKYVQDKYGIAEDMDSCVIGNVVQMRRIENTIHPKTGLNCIPISLFEMIFYTLDEIKALAKVPRTFEVCWIAGNEIKLDKINCDISINETYISKHSNGEFQELDNVLPDPCIARILCLRHPSHEERFLLCQWLSYHFRGGADINDFNLKELSEKIITFMRSLNWDDYSEALNTAKSTRYQVKNIINKKMNFVPNCTRRRMHNICCSEYCWESKTINNNKSIE